MQFMRGLRTEHRLQTNGIILELITEKDWLSAETELFALFFSRIL